MKILDRYILFRFLGTFFFTIALILSISIIFDISERLDDFLSKSAPVKEIIFEYYLSFLIFYGNQFSALIIFIAVIFFTSRMANLTEITAILGSGVSFNRFLVPYFIGASILAGISLYLNHFLVPTTNQSLLNFKLKYVDDPESMRYKHLHRRIDPTSYVYFESFNGERNVGYHFTLEKFKENELLYKMSADFARYDSLRNVWRIENYSVRTFTGDKQQLYRGMQLDTVLNFIPEDLGIQTKSIETMTFPELRKFIADEEARGSETINYSYIEMHKRTALSLATYILTLMAVSISFRKRRGGIGVNLAVGFAIVLVYVFFMQVSTTLATSGILSAWLAVWLPNIVFSFVALFLYGRALR